MNWIDFFVLFVLFLAMLNGYRRGFLKEFSTSLGLVIGVVIAVDQADWLASILVGKIGISQSILCVISFIGIFSVCIVLLKILGIYFYKVVKVSTTKSSDKIGGSIFGIVKGVIVLSLLFLFFVFPTPLSNLDDDIETSAMAKPIRATVPYLYDNLEFTHPKSGSFLSEVQKGILLSKVEKYADNPGGALKDKDLLGMTESDVYTLKKFNRYFGKKVNDLK